MCSGVGTSKPRLYERALGTTHQLEKSTKYTKPFSGAELQLGDPRWKSFPLPFFRRSFAAMIGFPRTLIVERSLSDKVGRNSQAAILTFFHAADIMVSMDASSVLAQGANR